MRDDDWNVTLMEDAYSFYNQWLDMDKVRAMAEWFFFQYGTCYASTRRENMARFEESWLEWLNDNE